MNRRQKIIVSVTGIFLVLLLLVGLTYAYFLTRITGNTNDKSISVKTANLALIYGDGNGILEAVEALVPGSAVKFKTASGDTVDKKTFTVTNQGNANTDYVVIIDSVSVVYAQTIEVDGVTQTKDAPTTFESNDFVYTLTCTSGCDGVTTPTTFPIEGGILVGNSIDVNEEQTYELSMTYLETGENQSNDMNKKLTARINIKDISTINPYSSNTSLLAYNIINNAILGATGTSLVAVPETEVAVSTSASISTGKTAILPATFEDGFYGWDGLTYGDTQTDADNGANEVSGSTNVEKCNSVIGKYISDASNCTMTCDAIAKVEACTSEGTPMISKVEKTYEKVLSITQDDYGTSYYYRGNVEDNYVEFNNMCWRIVRIEGDGSIKITLAAQKKCNEIDVTDTGSAFIGTGHYGYNKGKVTNSSGQQSTGDKNDADYVNSPTNNTTSMKYKLEEWFNGYLEDGTKERFSEEVKDLLKDDTKWCLGNTTNAYDSETGALLTSSVNDLMYNGTTFYYDGLRRLYGIGTEKYATLRCDGKNDESHESYIGALTADEVVFAGGKAGSGNYNYYLLDNAGSNWWWTLSIGDFDGRDRVFSFNGVGSVEELPVNYGDYANSDALSLRPAVSLKSSTVITGGNGTIDSPYKVG